MKIWIDLANSPQVLFFRPILQELERRGHTLVVTSRHFAQTIPLADRYGMRHTPVGGHGGKRLSKIGVTLFSRALRLLQFARGGGYDLALSHNSYAQALAACVLRIPIVTAMDYEHQPANHIAFRLASRVIVPECFPEASLRAFGADKRRVCRYEGVKEEIYLADFMPQPDFLRSVGLPPDKVIVAMRPPGTWGLYNHPENPVFDQVLQHVLNHKESYVVFLPRVASQANELQHRSHPNVWIPPRALDGPNLLYHADLVISGGGTMNREAAVLGTPTYSIFNGRLAAVDKYLMATGRMKHIPSVEDVPLVEVRRKQGCAAATSKGTLLGVVEAIEHWNG